MATTTTHWGRRAGSSTAAPDATRIRVEHLPVVEPVILLPHEEDRASARRLPQRLASGAARRLRALWRRWDNRGPAVETALDWLIRATPVGERCEGVTACAGQFDPCPALTGGVLATLANYAELELAQRLADWLASVQMPHGAFPDAGLRRASPLNTAQVVHAAREAARLTGHAPLRRQLDEIVQRAHEFLARAVDSRSERGARATPVASAAALNDLLLAAPLMNAEGRMGRATCERVFDRARRSIRRLDESGVWRGPLHVMLPGVEALIELGELSLARAVLAPVAAAQRRDGAIPALPGGSWISTTAVAHLAKLWYRLDEAAHADRALAWLRRRQERSGGFLGSYGRGACYYPRREVAWACKYFLDASRKQVEVSFARQAAQLPRALHAADGRLQAVLAWCTGFTPGARVVDVGCGRGRYLAALDGQFPHLRLAGVDPSAYCLSDLPLEVESIQGALPALPLPAASCDGVLAIESLEHTLVPQRSVAELCRVVRPGGRILIIDKHRAHQPLSDCEPWERWFAPDEVSGWLSRHCRDVKCVAVPHAQHMSPTGLFLCWTGTKL
ncbi:MAG: methyltransferase domain-containing protein [Planctomycetaceae bacterium]|nr:methyltransferase domain-containing protein [Planctomycetaceae bacterium]